MAFGIFRTKRSESFEFFAASAECTAFYSFITSAMTMTPLEVRLELLGQLVVAIDGGGSKDVSESLEKLASRNGTITLMDIKFASYASPRIRALSALGAEISRWQQLPFGDLSANKYNKYCSMSSTQGIKYKFLSDYRRLRGAFLSLNSVSNSDQLLEVELYLHALPSKPRLPETAAKEICQYARVLLDLMSDRLSQHQPE